ncbi:MAG: ABC transporter substrate-binding protein [Castellaniella sp.]
MMSFFLQRVLFAVLLVLLLSLQAMAQPAPRERLVLAGPPASVSFPLLHMVESGALSDVAEHVEFVLWSNPDQLRALAMEGKADFMAMPTNVAANLYNRGVPLQLMNVSVWGILWMVSRNPGLETLADFKGEEIAVPFRADMPDIVFSYLIRKSGLDTRRDFRLRYTPSPMDAMQLLISRRVDHALLAEPAVSMALRKTHSFPLSVVAPELYRSVNLQEEWGRLLQTEARIPQAGLVAVGPVREDAALMQRVEAAYADANRWCLDNARACGAEVSRTIDMVTPEAAADAIAVLPRHYAAAEQAREELDAFLGLLLAREPASVGERMPDAGFYGHLP